MVSRIIFPVESDSWEKCVIRVLLTSDKSKVSEVAKVSEVSEEKTKANHGGHGGTQRKDKGLNAEVAEGRRGN